jgi:hypothetical protein
MKRLLLSLCLVGVVFPGHTRYAPEIAQGPLVEARAVSPPESIAQPPNSGIEQVAVRSLAMGGEVTPSTTPPSGDIQKTPLPTTGESSETSVPLTPEGKNPEAIWVVVIRWATVHSGPSVSDPTVRFYSVGTELQLINHQEGWFQVLDPATSQRGWIYEKYYLQAIRGPGQEIAALQEPPKRKVVNAGKSTPHAIPHVRSAKSLETRPRKKTQPVIASAPRYRGETMANLLDSALRRW